MLRGSLALALALTLASSIINQSKRPLAILPVRLTRQCQLHRSSCVIMLLHIGQHFEVEQLW